MEKKRTEELQIAEEEWMVKGQGEWMVGIEQGHTPFESQQLHRTPALRFCPKYVTGWHMGEYSTGRRILQIFQYSYQVTALSGSLIPVGALSVRRRREETRTYKIQWGRDGDCWKFGDCSRSRGQRLSVEAGEALSVR